jgi:nitroreductase
MMEALEAIKTRRVQRAFADRPVELEKLLEIADAGRHAMSARNMQPWQFIVIRDRKKLREIANYCSSGKFLNDAPAAIAILKDIQNTRWADIDCAQAVQNMATAGWSMGLGTCWVGNFEAEKILPLLDGPSGWTLFTILPFGYRDPGNPPKNQILKPRAETVHFERFGNRKA